MTTDNRKWTYTFDEEFFTNGNFDSKESALEAARKDVSKEPDGNEQPLTSVFIGRTKPHQNSQFFPDGETITEFMQNQASDVGGEYADDYPNVGEEDEEELTKQLHELLESWCKEKGVVPNFYTVEDITVCDL